MLKVGLQLKNKIKSNLGRIIVEKGLKASWVAEKIGATPSQLTNWSKNDNEGFAKSTPSVLYILRLQKLLGVPVEEMYEEHVQEESKK